MHEYSIDSSERIQILLILGALGVGAAYLTAQLLEITDLDIPWWFDAPATLGYALLFFALFDRWLWSWSLFRTLELVKAPDLSGDWNATVASEGDKHSQPTQALVTIRQRWTRISITMEGTHSHSSSITANIRVTSHLPELTYVFRNEPWADAPASMVAHLGTASLRLEADGAQMRGEYYTGRTRHTYGAFMLSRVASARALAAGQEGR